MQFIRAEKELNAKGFTLVELLVVISIISLLSSVVFASVNSARAKARVGQAAAQLRQISTALNLYLDANGVHPCFDHAWDDTREKAWSAPYLSTWPKNPWGQVYHWEHNFGTGLTYSISIRGVPAAEEQALDKAIDDNNLAPASFVPQTSAKRAGWSTAAWTNRFPLWILTADFPMFTSRSKRGISQRG